MSDSTFESDRTQLHELGYAQELNRKLGWFSNFAISFSIISILAGGLTAYWLGMVTGGPRVITLGWLIVGFFALLVGMAMGAICSAYPTAGGLYYWSAKLARKNKAGWSWFTGWFNLLGQIGVIASVDYALAVFIAYFIRMFDDGFRLTVLTIFGIFLLVLIAHGLLNTFGVSVVRILGDISVWWHVIGVIIIVAVLMIAPDNTRGLGSVFDQAPPGLSGWTGGAFVSVYLFGLGLLLAQYTITGFDASAHVSEETVGARTEAPKAIVRAIYVSAIAAFFLNLAMTQAIPDDPDAYAPIAFGNADDPFLVNAAPRLISSAVGLTTAYAIPIYLRLTSPDFETGPWNLKGHHKLVGWTALVWIGLITVLFFAPVLWPFWPLWGNDNLITDDGAGSTFFKQNNFNFTGPLILLSVLGFWLYWRLSGRKWFTGPKVQGTPEELAAIERELEALGQGAPITPGSAPLPGQTAAQP